MSAVVPVAVFAYRRPDLLARALASLRANQVPLVYAWSDAPRDASAAADVAAVRALLRAVDWTDLRLVENPANIGCGPAVLGGVSRVLAKHEEIIVCEDDMEFVPGTYAWMCAALEHYRDDRRVMGVTAWNHPRVTPPDVTTEPYFSGRSTSWMWGTWRRAWDGMLDHTCADICKECEALGIDVTEFGEDNRNAGIYEATHPGMWDHRFNLHMIAQRGLFLWPARSMVAHTGYDPRATHAHYGVGWEDVPSPAPAVDSVRWPEVKLHPGSGPLWCRAVNAPPPPTFLFRVRRRIRRFLKDGT